MRDKDKVYRKIVERMLSGNATPYDFQRLLLGLRRRTFGVATIADIANLVAHETERDAGHAVETLSRVALTMQWHFALMNNAPAPLPLHMPDILDSLFEAVPEKRIKEVIGRRKRLLIRTFDALKRKLAPDGNGGLIFESLTDDEWDLWRSLNWGFTVEAPYEQNRLITDLSTVLQKNQFLQNSEAPTFRLLSDNLAIFIITLLQGTRFLLQGNIEPKLRMSFRGFLVSDNVETTMTFPMLHIEKRGIGVPVFTTTLDPRVHCEPPLDNFAPGTTFDGPVEIGPDWRIRTVD